MNLGQGGRPYQTAPAGAVGTWRQPPCNLAPPSHAPLHVGAGDERQQGADAAVRTVRQREADQQDAGQLTKVTIGVATALVPLGIGAISGVAGLQPRRSGVMRLSLASALCALLAAGAASSAGAVRLVPQPDIVARGAAFPRLAPGEPQAARINQALEAADGRARAAAEECRLQIARPATSDLAVATPAGPGRILGWTRRIAVAMQGPRYLALVTDDYADCDGAYPNSESIALTYDLRTGRPPDWSALLPKRLVQTVTVKRAMDETPLGMVGSPALRALYLAAVSKAASAISPTCMEALGTMAGPFTLWPDARQGGLMVQPSRLPHAFAACAVPAVIGTRMLRRQGVQPALLDAIAEAHRYAASRASGR